MRGECVSVDQAGSSINKRVKAQLIAKLKKEKRKQTNEKQQRHNIVVNCFSRLGFSLFVRVIP